MLAASVLAIIVITTFKLTNNKENEAQTVEALKAKHAEFLKNSPFAKTRGLSKSERKDLGLPPNAYYEQMWELTMDPNTGRPMPERVLELQAQLREDRLAGRGVSGTTSTPWIDRGPNNQGGRTRGIMFDPNDVGNANPADDYTRVFAGGVSGGLWVNDNITDANSAWSLVTSLQSNISVTSIISDPNNSNVFYIGSGESFTSGDAVGRGVWKSADGGVTWQNIFGGYTGFNSANGFVNGIFYVNDIVARNNVGTTELYAAVASAFYGDASSPNNFNGVNETGVYKSVDGGANWTRFNIQHADNSYKNPCDLEIDINNNIWLTTTRNVFNNAGGDIYRSTNGTSFSLIRNIPNASRTELEVSSNDANRLWVLANVNGQADLFTTTDAFSTINPMNEPNDADTGIPSTDFTRNQAFYDLVIEADANNTLYVGGIDLFRSFNNGATWSQISKWSNNNNLAALQVSLVHADQHALAFRPNSNGSEAVFGNDGGVFYSSNLASAGSNTNAIQERNKDYNTIQFYYGTIDGSGAANGDDIAGGTQDNGTQFVLNAAANANSFFDPVGGDGGFTEIDDSGQYVITTYPYNTHLYINYPSFSSGFTISTPGPNNSPNGSFINEAALDKNLNILYSNASSGTNRRIERTAEFLPGGAAQTNTFLTSGVMNSSPSALKVSPFTTGTTALFVGLRNGKVLKVNFANISPIWTDITGPSFVGSISDIEFGQSEQEIFVTIHNYGVDSIWYTTNGGSTWLNKEGNLPDIPVKCILQNPLIPQEVIIGTDLGVWATTDITVASPIWVPVYNGMSDVTVLDLDLRASDNVILASTHGRGMFTGQFTATPLSIDDNTINKNTLRIYPTVSNGNITISSTLNIGKVNLDVFSITGKKVYNTSIDLNGSSKSLKLNLSSGVYLVKFTKGTFTETKKIVIK